MSNLSEMAAHVAEKRAAHGRAKAQVEQARADLAAHEKAHHEQTVEAMLAGKPAPKRKAELVSLLTSIDDSTAALAEIERLLAVADSEHRNKIASNGQARAKSISENFARHAAKIVAEFQDATVRWVALTNTRPDFDQLTQSADCHVAPVLSQTPHRAELAQLCHEMTAVGYAGAVDPNATLSPGDPAPYRSAVRAALNQLFLNKAPTHG